MPSSCYAKLHLPFAKTLGYDCNAACMYRISTRADGARAGPRFFYLPAKKINHFNMESHASVQRTSCRDVRYLSTLVR